MMSRKISLMFLIGRVSFCSIILKVQPQIGNFNIEISRFEILLHTKQNVGRGKWWKCANGPFTSICMHCIEMDDVYRLANLKAAQTKRSNFYSFHAPRLNANNEFEKRTTHTHTHTTPTYIYRFRCAQCIKLIQKIARSSHTNFMWNKKFPHSLCYKLIVII